MSNSASVDGYLHVEGFESFTRDAFDKRKIRAGMRKAGRLVTQRAQMNLALGKGQEGYPNNRTGATLDSIKAKVSRSGFLVKIAPSKTPAMTAFYPAYLHYGVRQGSRVRGFGPGRGRRARGARADLIAARQAGGWRIAPRDNYMTDALQDSKPEVQAILSQAFAASLL